jgi:hypothetical protein
MRITYFFRFTDSGFAKVAPTLLLITKIKFCC